MPSTPRRALIVIDVQNEYVTGNLPIEYPDIHLSLANIGKVMDAARAADVPVIVVQHQAPAEASIFAKGSAGWELHDVVRSRPHDHHIQKTLPSAYAGTDLAQWLGERDIDTLTVIGYLTHNCNDSTIKQALHAGLAVEFLSDAAGSISYLNSAGAATAEEIHRTFSVVLQSRFAAVASTDQWIAALRNGMPLERDNILASNLRATAASSHDGTTEQGEIMRVIRSRDFVAPRAWGAIDIAKMNGITTRLHWTDQPYKWHVNDGEEVFSVLDGVVEMFYREQGAERSVVLQAGDIFFASVGCEHVAHPRGAARILVVQKDTNVSQRA